MKQYREYKFTIKDWLISAGLWTAVSGIISYFFYQSFIVFVLILLFYPLFIKFYRQEAVKKQLWNLRVQFLEMIQLLATNLQTGSNVEIAFRKTYEDLKGQAATNDFILTELRYLVRGLDNNEKIDSLLMDFGKRSGVDEVEEFAEVFMVSRNTGGNIRELIRSTCEDLTLRMDLEREKKTKVSSNEFELKILCGVPFGIIAYISFTNPGYFDGMYHNLIGISIMTACLTVYGLAVLWARKLINS